ncbi:hypothetical protein BKH43_07470 [Helicobacter sp. 13S00401-1]|uniref:ImmA/IrrE family metallo-endopeptidase n=1 Tax=Helicobacter sp. 13S00401-1 TaxID=1905758 RepID=UPI000BA50815|nr:ImmA/IrrE family metallo-endopeptidase [Helicobacter sp. 13S00401-1]PAF49024.1 hypothetical protein BKH43_07470 [Helicobacter sp. 13S00401-1]
MFVDYKKAKEQADILLQKAKINSYPVNLAAILNFLGLDAKYSDKIEYEAMLSPKEKTIFIRKDTLPMTRKFFSIAHEIGHWVLHSHDKQRPRINLELAQQVDDIDIKEEKEANAFASELLMPYDEVRKLIMIGYSPQNLQEYFDVSYSFAYNRYEAVYRMIY